MRTKTEKGNRECSAVEGFERSIQWKVSGALENEEDGRGERQGEREVVFRSFGLLYPFYVPGYDLGSSSVPLST